MPKIHVTKDEAAALKRRRAKNKAWNEAMQAALDKVRSRIKGAEADPLSVATLTRVEDDLRRMLRV
jgi:hypothetical protein